MAPSPSPQLIHLAPPVPTRNSVSPGQDSLASRTNMFQGARRLAQDTTEREACLRRRAEGAGLLGHGGRHHLPGSPDCLAEVSLCGLCRAPVLRGVPAPLLLCAGATRTRRPIRFLGPAQAGKRQKTPSPSHPSSCRNRVCGRGPQAPPSPPRAARRRTDNKAGTSRSAFWEL